MTELVQALQQLDVTLEAVNERTVEQVPANLRQRGLLTGVGALQRIIGSTPRGLPLTPTTSTLLAPRCRAGLIGADCRTAPSPKYSLPIFTGANNNGIAELASKWSTVN